MTLDFDDLRGKLNFEHDTINLSWRRIADMYGVSVGLIHAIAKNGHVPKDEKVRKRLDLPPRIEITTIIGDIPDGTVSLGAMRCRCGQWFISNHPRRRQCFICGPYRKRKR